MTSLISLKISFNDKKRVLCQISLHLCRDNDDTGL